MPGVYVQTEAAFSFSLFFKSKLFIYREEVEKATLLLGKNKRESERLCTWLGPVYSLALC